MGVASGDLQDKCWVCNSWASPSQTICLPTHVSEHPLGDLGGGEVIQAKHRAVRLASKTWPTSRLNELLKWNSG